MSSNNDFVNQLNHNVKFLCDQCENFPDKYFDWKVTSSFYVAIHAIKALAEKRGIYIGSNHQEIERNINPHRNNASMRISNTCWFGYVNLKNASRDSRYIAFEILEDHEDHFREAFPECFDRMNVVINYCKTQGELAIEPVSKEVTLDLLVNQRL